MIPRIKSISPGDDYTLEVEFDDGKTVIYDVKSDMEEIASYRVLREDHEFFRRVRLDESRTCVYWSEEIDLPSDTIYEYGISTNKIWE